MAYSNIFERRFYVRQVMKDGRMTSAQIKEAARLFDCSHSAIRADITHLNNFHRKLTCHVSARLRHEIRARDKDVCQYCGKHCDQPIVEHIVPASKGGPAIPDNLVVACNSCNMRKRYYDNAESQIRKGERLPKREWRRMPALRAGRKSGENWKPGHEKRIYTSVGLDPENYHWLKAEAERRGSTMAALVNDAIRAAMEAA